MVDGMGTIGLASLGNMVIRPGENTTNLCEILDHLTFHAVEASHVPLMRRLKKKLFS